MLAVESSVHGNARTEAARDSGDADAGAEWGAAPWKLGMLAAALFMWDVMWGTERPLYREVDWTISSSHIDRASLLMQILGGIRSGFQGNPELACVAGAAGMDGDTEARGEGEDWQSPTLRVVPNTPTTLIARRMICKAQRSSALETYTIATRR